MPLTSLLAELYSTLSSICFPLLLFIIYFLWANIHGNRYRRYFDLGNAEIDGLRNNDSNGRNDQDSTDRTGINDFNEIIHRNHGLPAEPQIRFIEVTENEIYSIKSFPRGYMLVINVNIWDGGIHERRDGSKEDVANLQMVGPMFGYKVITVLDPDKKTFEKSIKDFASDECHRDVDSAIIVIMSHGEQPEADQDRKYYSHSVDILTKDNGRVSTNWVLDQLTAENAPALAGKPKIVICATCRGVDDDYGLMIKKDGSSSSVAYPTKSDLLLVFPCLPGNVSYRNPKYGSFFIREFINVLLKNWANKDIVSMLEEVGRGLQDKYKIYKLFQIIDFNLSGFNKKFFFEKVTKEEEERLKES